MPSVYLFPDFEYPRLEEVDHGPHGGVRHVPHRLILRLLRLLARQTAAVPLEHHRVHVLRDVAEDVGKVPRISHQELLRDGDGFALLEE